MTTKLAGLVAATHTPFHQDGAPNLAAVEKQAEHLIRPTNVALLGDREWRDRCEKLFIELRAYLMGGVSV